LVGFAAETNNVTANALKKLKNKRLDLVVANNVLQAGAVPILFDYLIKKVRVRNYLR